MGKSQTNKLPTLKQMSITNAIISVMQSRPRVKPQLEVWSSRPRSRLQLPRPRPNLKTSWNQHLSIKNIIIGEAPSLWTNDQMLSVCQYLFTNERCKSKTKIKLSPNVRRPRLDLKNYITVIICEKNTSPTKTADTSQLDNYNINDNFQMTTQRTHASLVCQSTLNHKHYKTLYHTEAFVSVLHYKLHQTAVTVARDDVSSNGDHP